jgi:DNA-binding PadR family transcriptional regulator
MNRTSSLEYALLGMLRQKPQSGYDLRKAFATTPMRHFSDSPGSVYPALRRMQARGWIAGNAGQDNARKRQEFRITPPGTRAFIGWLRQPITHEDAIWGLEQLMLRFAFLDGNVGRQDTLRFLEEFEQELTAYVRELHEYQKNFHPKLHLTTGYLAFKNGVDSYQAQLAWVRHVRKQFAEALS